MNQTIEYHEDITIEKTINKEQFFIQKMNYSPKCKNLVTRPVHRHPFYEILLVLDGEMKIEVDFKEYTLKRGTLSLFSPLQVHYPKYANEKYQAYLIRFYSNIFDNINFLDEVKVFEYDYIKMQEHQFERARMLLNELFLESKSDLALKNFAIGNLLKCFLITIQRAIPETISEKGCENDFSKLNSFIVENKFKIAKPSEYADKMHISARTLNAITKKHTGISAGEYIRSKTIFEAQRLLCFSTLSIKEISYKLGFDDMAYYSRFFKKYTGLAPLQYRDNYIISNS